LLSTSSENLDTTSISSGIPVDKTSPLNPMSLDLSTLYKKSESLTLIPFDKFDDLEQKERKEKDRNSIINPLGSLYNDIFGD
jgi:hypothetical protein